MGSSEGVLLDMDGKKAFMSSRIMYSCQLGFADAGANLAPSQISLSSSTFQACAYGTIFIYWRTALQSGRLPLPSVCCNLAPALNPRIHLKHCQAPA